MMLCEALGPLQIATPDDAMLGCRQALQSAVIDASSPCDQLLLREKLRVIEPYLRHGVHVDKGSLV